MTGLSVTSVNASLVGDTVDAGVFRDTGVRVTGFGLDNPFAVAADDSDVKIYSDIFSLNMHGDGFSVDYSDSITGTRGWSSGSSFRLFDLDWVNDPTGKITGLTIDTNISGWASTLAVFGDDFVTLNWGGLFWTADTYFDVALKTNHSVVPVPAAVWLFGTALIGLVGFSKRKSKMAA